ncbi:protein AAR2 homolog isoform X1 [Cylas formicarius]|uniref:protein AAR2 homolog isoform X1 n=1 Tax=Cylas formicarius TaxID=197179 RepID=UPI002958756F|nr:protein AAR2 homolog isoform X1 [Cylas formicarius]
MDPKIAKKLFENGAIFVLLNVPEGTEFGIDLKSWNTGEKFRGVKMVPPGIHYIFYSSVSNTGDTAPRTGFFHFFKKSEVYVKKWDNITQGISTEEVSNKDVGLTDNLKVLDRFLGPYPYDILDRWKILTANITENLLKKLNPLCGEVRSALELENCCDADRPRGSRSETGESSSKRLRNSHGEDDLLPYLQPKDGTELRLTQFPEKCYPEGSSPSEITTHSLDSTYVLEKMIHTYLQPTDILGELELCYICFLVGHSLEAFEQWKKLFSLLCSCERALIKYRKIYDLFLNVVELQVKEVPEEFIADIVTNNNFVYAKLRDLFRFIRNSDADDQLKCKAERLRKSLKHSCKWDFGNLDLEEEDEAPVVVELG